MNINLQTFQYIKDFQNDIAIEMETELLNKYGIEESEKFDSEYCDEINDEVSVLVIERLKDKFNEFVEDERYTEEELIEIKEFWRI